MKIGIDASRANKDIKTGVEWYSWHIIQAMKKIQTEQDVQFVLYSREPLKGELSNLPGNWESKVLRWPIKLWTQLRLSYEMLTNPPDILFVPSHVFPIIHPKKTVMTIHDIAAATFPESYTWFSRWYTLWSARFGLRSLWKIIVPSEFVKKDLRGKARPRRVSLGRRKGESPRLGSKGEKDKIVVIPHGYDKRYRVIEDQEQIDKVLEKFSIKKPFILNIGRLGKKKNTKRLVEAFSDLDYRLQTTDYRLVIVGGRDVGWDEVLKAVEQSSKKDKIKIIDHVGLEDLPYIMNAAEVFVFPSLQEGFGLPVLEAMACGTPVVAAKGSSLEEVGGNACEYVDPGRSESILAGLNTILTNSEFRQRNTDAGMQRVADFSWERAAGRVLDIFLKI